MRSISYKPAGCSCAKDWVAVKRAVLKELEQSVRMACIIIKEELSYMLMSLHKRWIMGGGTVQQV